MAGAWAAEQGVDVKKEQQQSPLVSCVFVMKCARLPMHNQICRKQVAQIRHAHRSDSSTS